MKIRHSRTSIVALVAVGALVLGVAAYSATSQVIGVGTMEHSELIGGPATLTMRLLTIESSEVLGGIIIPARGPTRSSEPAH